jgi:predicted transposase YdaD
MDVVIVEQERRHVKKVLFAPLDKALPLMLHLFQNQICGEETGMTKPWDRRMEGLFNEAPQDFVEWLMPGATYVNVVSPELEEETTFTDILCEIILAGKRMLLHIEFQKRRDSRMAERLWAYNQKATLKYKCPVWSVVVYLVEDSPIAQSPLTKELPDGRPVHRFDFDVICLWETATEELKQRGLIGLLPLLPLTRDAARQDVVEEVITELMPPGEEPKAELLTLTYGLASLVFENKNREADLEWLIGRFAKMYDLLRETRAFQDLTKETREEALQEGREEGKLEGIRQTLLKIVQTRFSNRKLTRLAKGAAAVIDDPEELQDLIARIIQSQTPEEAKQHLLAIDEDEEEDE